MIRRIWALGALTLLAACGVDGAPQAPEPSARSGVSVSGHAVVGVQAEL